MRIISLHVTDAAYQDLKCLSAHRHVPVAELIRQAMDEFIKREQQSAPSLLDIPPHDSGPLVEPWTREDLMDEMAGRS